MISKNPLRLTRGIIPPEIEAGVRDFARAGVKADPRIDWNWLTKGEVGAADVRGRC